jgi:pyruvate formate-lyase activating enzyme-like uncharacterized protein
MASKSFLSETFERYALGLLKSGLPSAPPSCETSALIGRLGRAGIKGWKERMTFYTRSLPTGCRPCLEGRGSNLAVTLKCNKDCFFCFNPKPRDRSMSVHGRKVKNIKAAVELLRSLRVRSIGLSGGEPLLELRRVLALTRALKAGMPQARIDLYTNGSLLSSAKLKQLKTAGIDGLRLNLAAAEYDCRPAALAKKWFADVDVEIPVIPEDFSRILHLLEGLETVGVRHLIVHELFASGQNIDKLQAQGRKGKVGPANLAWAPVAGSEEAALRIMLEALKRRCRLSVYYCSCATQGWIAQRATEASAR